MITPTFFPLNVFIIYTHYVCASVYHPYHPGESSGVGRMWEEGQVIVSIFSAIQIINVSSMLAH